MGARASLTQSAGAAAALSEWPDPKTDGLDAVREYTARYGGLADQPLPTDLDFPHDDISADEFEDVWRNARANLEDGPRR